VNGIAKTAVGFLAASVGIRIDVENHTIRLLLSFLLSLLSSVIVVFVSQFFAGAGFGVELVHDALYGNRSTRSSRCFCSRARSTPGSGIRDKGNLGLRDIVKHSTCVVRKRAIDALKVAPPGNGRGSILKVHRHECRPE